MTICMHSPALLCIFASSSNPQDEAVSRLEMQQCTRFATTKCKKNTCRRIVDTLHNSSTCTFVSKDWYEKHKVLRMLQQSQKICAMSPVKKNSLRSLQSKTCFCCDSSHETDGSPVAYDCKVAKVKSGTHKKRL